LSLPAGAKRCHYRGLTTTGNPGLTGPIPEWFGTWCYNMSLVRVCVRVVVYGMWSLDGERGEAHITSGICGLVDWGLHTRRVFVVVVPCTASATTCDQLGVSAMQTLSGVPLPPTTTHLQPTCLKAP
jgi:hypothetical protein